MEITVKQKEELFAEGDGFTVSGKLSVPWYVNYGDEKVYPPRHNNNFELLICGQEAFEAIYNAMENAKATIDVMIWGFDPGMRFVRPHGPRVGELLEEKARLGIRVRLVLWYGGWMAQKGASNLYGFRGQVPWATTASGGVAPMMQRKRFEYVEDWFKRAEAGRIPNLELRTRGFDSAQIKKMMAGLKKEKFPPNWSESIAFRFASHHQKQVMVDYEVPERAIGFVMGHNMRTEYWDTRAHSYGDPYQDMQTTSESLPEMNQGALREYDGTGQTYGPWQDLSCRIEGACLYDLNDNFCTAWEQADFKHPQPESGLLARRKALVSEPSLLTQGRGSTLRHTAQVCRTFPHEDEIAIKRAYWLGTANARHYIYLENQYFFYQEWAQYLKECAKKLYQTREKYWSMPPDNPDSTYSATPPYLHVFVVTVKPESAAMLHRTYDTLKELGLGAGVKELHAKEEKLQSAQQADCPPDNEPECRRKDLDQLVGLKVLAATLKTYAPDLVKAEPSPNEADKANDKDSQKEGQPSPYQDIYVHSKLMLVDDVFFTIGSANLNQRSMAVDSELNLISDASTVTAQWRKYVWQQHTGLGARELEAVEDAFDDWDQLMKKNDNHVMNNEALEPNSFVVSFFDDREPSYFKVG